MGVKIKDLVPRKTITLDYLRGKVVAVDTMNVLYQFLTTIRGYDGAVLTNRDGVVTSHLLGLFNRTTALLQAGIKPIFIFDGTPPKLKEMTLKSRQQSKQVARDQLKEAQSAGDTAAMQKYAARTARLTTDMVNDAKKLVTALGLPIVQAPSEGEAQAAHLVKTGQAYAAVSQDYDTLLFGCPRLVRNLSLGGKKKRKGKFAFDAAEPEIIMVSDVYKATQLNATQLILLAILIGTDYNPKGIPGIGPKKGLKLVQQKEPNQLFGDLHWDTHYPTLPWQKLLETFQTLPVIDVADVTWQKIDEPALLHLLVDTFHFDADRITSKLRVPPNQQTGLGAYF